MMEDRELLEELQAGLGEQGVEVTVEEIQAAIDKLEADELTEDNLEDVSGGCMGVVGVGVAIALSKLAYCRFCGKVYVRKKGHNCFGGSFVSPDPRTVGPDNRIRQK